MLTECAVRCGTREYGLDPEQLRVEVATSGDNVSCGVDITEEEVVGAFEMGRHGAIK